MVGRSIILVAGLIAAWSQILAAARAAELNPEEARKFVAGKYFSYSCFDGTTGAGRINADGSVVGTIQSGPSTQVHYVALPPGTIRLQSDSICATLRGMPFEPCFKVEQTDPKSFRGSLTALTFAYCDFTRRNPRLETSNQNQRATHPTDWGMLRTSVDQ
jgi:hypothetical protein